MINLQYLLFLLEEVPTDPEQDQQDRQGDLITIIKDQLSLDSLLLDDLSLEGLLLLGGQ